MTRIIMLISLVVGMGQVFAAWDGMSAEKPEKVGDFCIIDTEAKLAWYATAEKENNYAQCNAKLTADLDLGNKLWIPIAAGTGTPTFSRTFDGNGHTIKNLYINGADLFDINPRYAQNVGFIGVLGGGSVKNLTLENVDIQASTSMGETSMGSSDSEDHQISVGAFVGWMNESAKNLVDACMVTGTIKTTGNGQGVGGIVGNAKTGTISNCLSLVDIQASGREAYVGGIIGIIKINVKVMFSVYAGPGVKTGVDGAVGAIAGFVPSSPNLGKFVAKDAFFEDEELNGIGKIGKKCNEVPDGEDCNDVSDGSKKVEFSNVDDVVVLLNNEENATKPWSVGNTTLLLYGHGPDGYRIVFDANGGTFGDVAYKSLILKAGQVILASEVEKPELEGFTFKGWAFTKDAEQPSQDLGKVSASDTLFAVWNPIYTVTFNVAPGVFPGTEVSEKTVRITKGDVVTIDELGELPTEYCIAYDEENETVCKTYSYITGWALSSNSSDIVDLGTVTVSEGLSLHAVWKDTDVETYTLTFNANQHGKTAVSYVHVEAGKTAAKPTDPVADEGYKFVDWYTEEIGTTKFDFTKPVTGSDLLYAKWDLENFKIDYVLNGATNNAKNPESYTIESNTIQLADPIAAEGYDFEGWFYDADFTQKATQIINGTSGDKTLYAKCVKKTYKVTYLADNNTYGSVSDQIKEYGTPLTLAGDGFFTRAGYGQIGWSDKVDGDKVYDFKAKYEANAPIILYPAWEKNANQITYELGGGTNDSLNADSYTEQHLEDGKVIELKDPYKCGFRFNGWYDNDKFTGSAITEIKKGTTGDLKLYAKWTSLPQPLYTYGPIKVYSDDGRKCAIMENGSTSNVTKAPKPLNTPIDVEINFVTYDRVFPVNRYDDDKMYSTIVLPFSIDKSKVDGAVFYEFNGVAIEGNEKVVQISPLSDDKIMANKPYIIRTTKAKLSFNIKAGETVILNPSDRSNLVVSKGQWEFRGMYSYKKWKANDPELGFAYGYAAKAAKNLSVGQFARNAAGAFVYPFRAYLLYTPSAKAEPQFASNFLAKNATMNQSSIDGFDLPETMKIVIVDGKQETIDQTPGFNILKTVPGPVKFRNGWFDMMGRKLNGKPTAKGVYYYNGKRIRIY